MQFWKMNGAGNDFIILNNLQEGLSADCFPALAGGCASAACPLGRTGLMVVEAAAVRRGLPNAVLQLRRQRGRDVRQRGSVHLPLWL